MDATNVNFAFCPPLPGKPNPNEPYIEGQPRSRVVLNPQKGNTCELCALNILRNEKRIGKHSSTAGSTQRKHEVIFSSYKKLQIEIDAIFQPQLDFANQLTKSLDVPCDKNIVQNLLLKADKLFPAEHKEFCCKVLNSFVSQNDYTLLLDYVDESYIQALRKINEKLFTSLNWPCDAISLENVSSLAHKEISQITNRDILCYEKAIIFTATKMAYSMKNSIWHPESPISELIDLLQKHGPHLVKGQFGKEYYASAPFELPQKIENRPIFAWKAGAEKILRSENHAVVVVGAKSLKDKEFVYFIDPNDGSDPKDLSTQKVYVVSYATFRLQIASLHGLRIFDKKMQNRIYDSKESTGNNYALHM